MRKIIGVLIALACVSIPVCACAEWGGPDVYYHPETGAYRTNEGERVHVRDPGAKQRRVEWKYGRYSIYAMRRRFELIERYREERRERATRFDNERDRDWHDGDVTYRERDDRDTHSVACKVSIKTVGRQYVDVKGAQNEAIVAWTDMVRYRHGEMFADFANALHRDFRCVQSSINGIKVGPVKLGAFYRCEVVAMPCTAPRASMPSGQDTLPSIEENER